MSWLDFSWLDLSWLEPHDLTWPDLIFPGLAWPDLTCPELTFPNLLGLINLSNLTYTEWTCPDFIWPVLTCPDLTWYVLKLPVLTWSVLIWPRKIQVKLNSQAGPECGKMFRTQTIQALDTIHTPKIHSRQLPTTIGKYIQNVKLYPGLVGCRYIIMPLRGPTYKIARFQAELKIICWNQCGKKML